MDLNQLIKNGVDLEGVDVGARIVVAMSGGVDSSVCAALTKKAGYDVIGLTMQLYDQGGSTIRAGGCCSGGDVRDARGLAGQLGIPHYVLDYQNNFQSKVVDDFVDTYLAGATPIPCIRCNETMKFVDLLEMSRNLGAQAMVTGHYVRRVLGGTGPELHAAEDIQRDQSYFLFSTTRTQLEYLRFPLGNVEGKHVTRDIARALNLRVAEKPDSQDICFVPAGRYVDVVNRLRPDADVPGEIVDVNGNVLGRHPGIVNFTVGQRKGLGLGGSVPAYVLRIEPDSRRVVVGPRELLSESRIFVKDVNWLALDRKKQLDENISIRIRSSQNPVSAQIVRKGEKNIEVLLEEPEFGVSPGQACVMYKDTRVLGGGWITRESKGI